MQSIVVEPGNATLSIGGTQQFTATAYYSDGSSKEVTNEVTWESSDKGIATIDNAGLATGIDVGNAQITASLEGVSSNPVPVSVDRCLSALVHDRRHNRCSVGSRAITLLPAAQEKERVKSRGRGIRSKSNRFP